MSERTGWSVLGIREQWNGQYIYTLVRLEYRRKIRRARGSSVCPCTRHHRSWDGQGHCAVADHRGSDGKVICKWTAGERAFTLTSLGVPRKRPLRDRRWSLGLATTHGNYALATNSFPINPARSHPDVSVKSVSAELEGRRKLGTRGHSPHRVFGLMLSRVE